MPGRWPGGDARQNRVAGRLARSPGKCCGGKGDKKWWQNWMAEKLCESHCKTDCKTVRKRNPKLEGLELSIYMGDLGGRLASDNPHTHTHTHLAKNFPAHTHTHLLQSISVLGVLPREQKPICAKVNKAISLNTSQFLICYCAQIGFAENRIFS